MCWRLSILLVLLASPVLAQSSDLVRFSVCYVDGVPVSVGSTCSSGVLTSYPLFASTVLSAPSIPPSAGGICLYKSQSYPDGYVLTVTVNKNQVDSTQAALLEAGWSVTTKQVKGKYEIKATC